MMQHNLNSPFYFKDAKLPRENLVDFHLPTRVLNMMNVLQYLTKVFHGAIHLLDLETVLVLVPHLRLQLV